MTIYIRIMEWNANGLLQHQHELQVILCTENIDICLIAETHFTKESFIGFQNYTTYVYGFVYPMSHDNTQHNRKNGTSLQHDHPALG
jgi:exonuclease III